MSILDGGSSDSERLARIVAVSRRLAAESDLKPALRFLMESAVALTGAERGFLLFHREGRLSCEAAVPEMVPVPGPVPSELSRSVLGRVLAGEPVLSTDLPSDGRFQERASVRRLGLRSVLAVPLPCRAGAAAYLYLDSRVGRTLFREVDRDLVVALATQGALALENAALAERLPADNGRDRAPRAAAADAMPGRTRRGTAHEAPFMIGSSEAMAKVLDVARRVAVTDLPVLIIGESGTGKELLARVIHAHSPRAPAPFIAENCAAIPETLIESELFGAVRGAYTGADRDREGLFRAADGGTLFLDEIGEMPPGLQVRLLRAIQEREVRPVGSSRVFNVDVRILAATNRDAAAAIASGRLRLALYYRVAGVTLELPPLRDRREEIPSLAAHFLERSSQVKGTAALRLSPEALLRLASHDWPGNVRELENEVERAAALARGDTIEEADLSARVRGRSPAGATRPHRSAERTMIEAALLGAEGSVAGAARTVGWSRQKLYRRMVRLGVPRRFGRRGADDEDGGTPSVPDDRS